MLLLVRRSNSHAGLVNEGAFERRSFSEGGVVLLARPRHRLAIGERWFTREILTDEER